LPFLLSSSPSLLYSLLCFGNANAKVNGCATLRLEIPRDTYCRGKDSGYYRVVKEHSRP